MADHGCDQDATWKWAFRKSYKRQPKPEELQRYKYWHGVSRQISFAAAGPWDCWPSKAIPDDAQPVLEAADAVEDTGVHVATGAEPRRRHTRPRAKERAEAFVREQLANGPRHGESVKRDAAEAAKISERTLIAAAERLGVRTQRGQWWLPPA
jgi:hypothetical protein